MKDGWKIYVLEHDAHSTELAESLQHVFPLERRDADVTFGQNRSQIMSAVRKSVDGDHERILTLLGNGYAHKMTYGLCKHVADKRSGGYVYYHFDAHGDLGRIDARITHGGFVARLFNDTNAQDVVFFGHWFDTDYCHRYLARGLDMSVEEFDGMRNPNAPDAYCSFDLDCLEAAEIKTGFPGGMMSVPELVGEIGLVKVKKKIISADVLGYAGERDAKSHLAYAIVMEALMAGSRVETFMELHDAAKRGKLDYDGMISEFGKIPKIA